MRSCSRWIQVCGFAQVRSQSGPITPRRAVNEFRGRSRQGAESGATTSRVDVVWSDVFGQGVPLRQTGRPGAQFDRPEKCRNLYATPLRFPQCWNRLAWPWPGSADLERRRGQCRACDHNAAGVQYRAGRRFRQARHEGLRVRLWSGDVPIDLSGDILCSAAVQCGSACSDSQPSG